MESVTVLDSPCGEGKTTWCIKYMKENIDKNKFIYVTPFKKEIERVRDEINGTGKKKELKIYEPNLINDRKYNDFVKLLTYGKSIATTHSLFGMCTDEIVNLLVAGQYTLILDEVMNVVEEYKVKKDDTETMLKSELIKIEDDGLITWLDKSKDTRYDDFKIRCLNKSIYYLNKKTLCWTFPVQIFRAFKKVIISTYMYDCQIQRYYYDFFNIKYTKVSVKDGEIVPFYSKKINTSKIHICTDNKINYIGDVKSSLSKGWYIKREKENNLAPLKNAITNYFIHITKAKSKDIIWTSFKDYKSNIENKGYTKGFVSCNARATNDYGDRHYVAYAINKYLNPYITAFFRLRNVELDEDNYALSEMIQFICRSAIRNNEDIYIYVPSKRMRELLANYCSNL